MGECHSLKHGIFYHCKRYCKLVIIEPDTVSTWVRDTDSDALWVYYVLRRDRRWDDGTPCGIVKACMVLKDMGSIRDIWRLIWRDIWRY